MIIPLLVPPCIRHASSCSISSMLKHYLWCSCKRVSLILSRNINNSIFSIYMRYNPLYPARAIAIYLSSYYIQLYPAVFVVLCPAISKPIPYRIAAKTGDSKKEGCIIATSTSSPPHPHEQAVNTQRTPPASCLQRHSPPPHPATLPARTPRLTHATRHTLPPLPRLSRLPTPHAHTSS